jgi:hypothetical protein
MPFLNAFPATYGSGMLGSKDRMPSHGGLFAVIFGKIGGNPGFHKLICVLFYGWKTFVGYLILIFF